MQSAWGIGLKADVGSQPPARREGGKEGSWEDEKVGKRDRGMRREGGVEGTEKMNIEHPTAIHGVLGWY